MRLGKVKNTILERSVFKLIHQRGLPNTCKPQLGQDAGRLEDGKNAMLSSMACNYMPVFRAVNNIYAAGGYAAGIQVGVVLGEKAREIRLKEIISDLERQCALLDIPIVGGHTTVSSEVNKPIVMVTAMGYEQVKRGEIRPGQDIVLTKWIGISGIRQVINAKRDEIGKIYAQPVMDRAYAEERDMLVREECLAIRQAGIPCYMHDVSEGGVFAALWDMAEYGHVGIDVDCRKIGVCQEVIEICEMYNINPYEFDSLGCLLVTSENGCDIVNILNAKGIPAAVIGSVTEGNKRIIRNREEERFLDIPKMDEIYKLMERV